MTIRALVGEAAARLAAAGVPEPELDARLLFEAASAMTGAAYYLHREESAETLSPEVLSAFEDYTAKREKRIPVAYLLGEADFCGLTFEVNEAVLIPEQDTECVAEEAMRYSAGRRVLDLCTGSGCIGVTLAILGKASSVTATDLSEKALEVAGRNAGRLLSENGLPEERVRFLQGDLFAPVEEEIFDLIVSNPPYIRTDVIWTLAPEVKTFEPDTALDGGDDGLVFYRRIAAEAGRHLTEEGRLVLEIGFDQAVQVTELLEAQGFRELRTGKDLAGLDRFVSGLAPRG